MQPTSIERTPRACKARTAAIACGLGVVEGALALGVDGPGPGMQRAGAGIAPAAFHPADRGHQGRRHAMRRAPLLRSPARHSSARARGRRRQRDRVGRMPGEQQGRSNRGEQARRRMRPELGAKVEQSVAGRAVTAPDAAQRCNAAMQKMLAARMTDRLVCASQQGGPWPRCLLSWTFPP